MCYVRKTKAEQEAIGRLRTKEEWLQLGEEAKKAGMLYLLLTGGEPFLYPEFREVLSGLQKMGLIITINTNGTMIDEETISWLKECVPSRFNVTLYGASDETYEKLCGNPKGFTQVKRALRLMKEAGFSIKINFSVTPNNIHDLEAVFAFCNEEELVIQATDYMFPPIRRNPDMVGENEMRFSAEEAAYHMARIMSLTHGEEAFVSWVNENKTYALLDEGNEDCPEVEAEGDGIRCRAGKCSFWITWEGKMLPCGMFPSEGAPKVFETKFETVWETVRKSAGAVRLPAKCTNCELRKECKACAAMVISESGDFSKVPEYRCTMSKCYHTACVRVKNEILSRKESSK
jgi:MoaA/NifB/PqqE/SkfB family radical SAM enzyme